MSIPPTARTRNAPNRRSSLIYHSGALGDFISAFPAIVCWSRLAIEDRRILLTRREHGDLALRAEVVDEVRDIDESRFSRLFLGDGAPIVSDRPRRALLFCSPDSPLIGALRSAGCPEITLQPPFPPDPQPIVRYHLSLFPNPPEATELFRPLRMLGEDPKAATPETQLCRDAVLIHPGSGGEKNWPTERFERLAVLLRKRGARVVWCLGRAEKHYRLPVTADAVREPTLVELCAMLTRARCYIGNDSGVSHLAAACGCPSVVLFGPSDERIWAPCGDAVEIVAPPGNPTEDRNRDIARIEVEQVLAAVDRLLDCDPPELETRTSGLRTSNLEL